MAAISLDLNRLLDLVLSYFKAEEPDRRISREQFYTESWRMAGGRDVQDLIAVNINAQRLVHHWCSRGDAGRLADLLGMRGVNLELDSPDGTPLCIAARHGKVEAVDLLLKAGARLPDLPQTPADCQGNPWFECCASGSSAVFHLLLAARQDFSPLPPASLNLLLEAAAASVETDSESSDGLAIVRTLQELGATAATSEPTTVGLRAGNVELLTALLAKGAPCDPREAVHAQSRDRTLRDALAQLMHRRSVRPDTGALDGAGKPSIAAQLSGVRLAWLSPVHLPDAESISELTLVDCGLTCLPAALLHGLPRLRLLDVSRNNIASLEEAPQCTQPSRTLLQLNLSQNCLKELPPHVFAVESLQELIVAKNLLGRTAWNSAPWACRQLQILDLSDNGIVSMPPQLSQVCGRLLRLLANGNQLTSFQSWACPMEVLELSKNSITDVPGNMATLWQNSLRELRLSDNRLSAEKSVVLMVAIKTLSRLCLARNKLTTLPSAHLWHCEKLFELDLAGNQLKERLKRESSSGRLPIPWFLRPVQPPVYEYELEIPKQLTSLHRLFLSDNRLDRVPPSVCQLAMLETLDISGNRGIRQIPVELAQCSQLMRLVCDPAQLQEPLRQFAQKDFVSTIPLLNHLRLQLYRTSPYYHLKLVVAGNGDNDRRSLMQHLGFVQRSLDTSRSLYLHQPAAVSDSASGGGEWQSLDRAVRDYIQNTEAPLRRSLRDALVKPPIQTFHLQLTRREMLEVSRRGGGQRRGTQDNRLGGRQAPDDFLPVHVQSVHLHAWVLKSGVGGGIGGSPAIDSIHEIVLTKHTLYLLLWDCLDGKQAFDKIKQSLLTIQARAPKSFVIAVGQNLVQGDEFALNSLICSWQQELANSPGYPPVVEFLTLPDQPDEQSVASLRWSVLRWSLLLPCPEDAQRGRVIGRELPLFFTNAMELVVQRLESIQHSNNARRYVPLITEDEMLELLKNAARNCKVPSQAFEKAIDFMHELGILLHIRGDFNPSLFCPNPPWFLFVLQAVVLFKSVSAVPQRGELQISQLKSFLTSALMIPEDHTDTFIHLLHELNICHKLNDKTLLFPNDLSEHPTEPLDPETVPRESLQPCRALLRVYRFPYCPPGLWPRLAARLHTAVADLKERARVHLAAGQRGRRALVAKQPSMASRLLYSSSIGAADAAQLLSRSSRSLGGWERELLGRSRSSVCCWRSGFMVKHAGECDDGRFGIQLSNGGVELELCVLSRQKNFAPIGLLVDEVDLLLETWFPGLAGGENDDYTDVGEDDDCVDDRNLGDARGNGQGGLMQRMVPCPECLASLMDGGYMTLSSLSERVPDWRAKVHWFSYRHCAERALTRRPLRCPRCRAALQPSDLVPELLFADVDKSIIVEASRLRLRREPDCLLGEGSFGSVYKAWLDNVPVAAKIIKFLESFMDFQQQQQQQQRQQQLPSQNLNDEPVRLRPASGRRSSALARSTNSASESSPTGLPAQSPADSLVQLQLARLLDQAIDGLKQMRREANVLQSLRHPFLVEFRGICLEPLCFLTELAPLGSLANVRQEAHRQRPGIILPLGRQLTFKIAYQVISAIAYMHSQSVLYRDLKTDNVLVFSVDPLAERHVKLGDYGTSLNTGLQGVTGKQGTPGYIAPEVLQDCTYDEKVDVYSFGMLLYELIIGDRPFSKLPSNENLTRVVLNGRRPDLMAQEAEQAGFLGQLAQRCWRQSPGARPTAAGVCEVMKNGSRWAMERFIALPREAAAPPTETPVDSADSVDFVGAMARPDCACITELLESSVQVLFLWKQLSASAAASATIGRQQSRQFAIVDLDTGWWRQAPTFCAGPPVLSMRRARSVYCLFTWFDTAGGRPQLQICSYLDGRPDGFHVLRELPLTFKPSPVESALFYDSARDRLTVVGHQSLLLFTGFANPQLLSLSGSTVCQMRHEIRLLAEEHQVSAVAFCPTADWFAVRRQLETPTSGGTAASHRRYGSHLIAVDKETLCMQPVPDELSGEVECLISDAAGRHLFLSFRGGSIVREFDTAELLFVRAFNLAGQPSVGDSLACDLAAAAEFEYSSASATASLSSTWRRQLDFPPTVSQLGFESNIGLLLIGRSVGDLVGLAVAGPHSGRVWTVGQS